jgi:outer membrane protein
MFPDLNAAGTHAYNYGRTVDRFTNQFANDRIQSNNFYLSSRVVIFNGFQLYNSVKQNRINVQAGRMEADKMRDDVSLAVATAYLQVLYGMEMLENARMQLEITGMQLERAKKLVEAGTLARGGQLSIEAQYASEELDMVNAQNSLNMAYLNLAQLMELNAADGLAIKKPELTFTRSPLLEMRAEQIFSFALERQPEIKSAELRLQSAQKGLTIARGTSSPNLMLTGSYGTGYSGASMQVDNVYLKGYEPSGFTGSGDTVYSPAFGSDYSVKSFKDQIDDNSNYTLGLQLSVPLFNGWQSRTSISRAKIAISQSELSMQQAKNTLFKTIQQAQADATAAYNRYMAGIKTADALDESFRYSEKRFNVGLVNSVEYSDAKTRLNIARSNVLQAKYEYVFRVKVLEFYMGNPLVIN